MTDLTKTEDWDLVLVIRHLIETSERQQRSRNHSCLKQSSAPLSTLKSTSFRKLRRCGLFVVVRLRLTQNWDTSQTGHGTSSVTQRLGLLGHPWAVYFKVNAKRYLHHVNLKAVSGGRLLGKAWDTFFEHSGETSKGTVT